MWNHYVKWNLMKLHIWKKFHCAKMFRRRKFLSGTLWNFNVGRLQTYNDVCTSTGIIGLGLGLGLDLMLVLGLGLGLELDLASM